jgi:hypothetical protein
MEETNTISYTAKMTNGDKHNLSFRAKNNLDVKAWLNQAQRFITIGDDEIINLDHVVSFSRIKEEEDMPNGQQI